MADFSFSGKAGRTIMRPLAVLAVVVGILSAILWANGQTPYSQTQPYSGDVQQNPTGAGSNPDGVVGKSVDGVNMPVENAAPVTGSADANDLTGIERTAPQNTVADEGRVKDLAPGDVVSPEEGRIDPDTGMVVAPTENPEPAQ